MSLAVLDAGKIIPFVTRQRRANQSQEDNRRAWIHIPLTRLDADLWAEFAMRNQKAPSEWAGQLFERAAMLPDSKQAPMKPLPPRGGNLWSAEFDRRFLARIEEFTDPRRIPLTQWGYSTLFAAIHTCPPTP